MSEERKCWHQIVEGSTLIKYEDVAQHGRFLRAIRYSAKLTKIRVVRVSIDSQEQIDDQIGQWVVAEQAVPRSAFGVYPFEVAEDVGELIAAGVPVALS